MLHIYIRVFIFQGGISLMYHLYYPSYYYTPVYNTRGFTDYHRNLSELPVVETNILYQSANELKKLMKDASIFLDKLVASNELNANLLNALPASIYSVRSIIDSIGIESGITSEVRADYYDPGVLKLFFISTGSSRETIEINLRWS